MANIYAVNTQATNTASPQLSVEKDNIVFDGYWLQNAEIVFSDENSLRDYPLRRIDLIDRPQADWQILNDVFFSGRPVTVTWILKVDDPTTLNSLIDEFKMKLSWVNKKLEWRVDWKFRSLNATVRTLKFEPKNRIHIFYEIEFISPDSYWTEENYQSYIIEGVTNSPIIESIRNEWEKTKWFTVFWFKNWTSITSVSYKVNGVWLDINTAINSGDILYIDWENFVVSVNWIEIDYDWVIPEYEKWPNRITVDIQGSFETDVTFLYPLKYL